MANVAERDLRRVRVTSIFDLAPVNSGRRGARLLHSRVPSISTLHTYVCTPFARAAFVVIRCFTCYHTLCRPFCKTTDGLEARSPSEEEYVTPRGLKRSNSCLLPSYRCNTVYYIRETRPYRSHPVHHGVATPTPATVCNFHDRLTTSPAHNTPSTPLRMKRTPCF